MPDHYAVIGNPVAHSRSPEIHHAFAAQFGIAVDYQRVLAPLNGFAELVHAFVKDGYQGANVTVPFKLQAYQLASELTERAMDAGAVNTLTFNAGAIVGDNTDGVGLVQDVIRNLGVSFSHKRVLLIGAGGAAEGVLHPMLEQMPSLLVIANRTLDKALSMVKKVRDREEKMQVQGDFRLVSVNAHAFEDLHGQAFDIVINATSVGLTQTALPLPPDIFAPGALAYEMMYGHETVFMAFARRHGAGLVVDGLGMLVEQAAEAFYVWNQRRPETRPVILSIRDSIIRDAASRQAGL